jgi:hypothetical protein
MARSDDTKLLCHAAQMIIALSGVSLWPLSGGKSLVLCQHEEPEDTLWGQAADTPFGQNIRTCLDPSNDARG